MSLEQAIQDARRAINRDLIPARLGNGTGTVYDLTTPGNYFLRKLEADGKLSQPFSLPVNPLANIPPVDGMPVDIGYDARGVQCIWQCNTASMLSANVNPLILNPIDTAVYGKQSQTNIATLYYQRHGDTTNFPFTVVVFKAPVIINGVAKFFAGAGISLSSFVPATGLHCYASVFLRTDMTLEAFASTPTNLLDPLTVDTDIADCISQASANSIIICAWELLSGDTALSPSPARNVDMRQIVNTGSSSASNTLTVTDGSTTVTDVTEIDYNGSDFTITDLGSGVVQIDLVTPSTQVFPTAVSIFQQTSTFLVGSSSWSYVYASAPFGYVLYQASHSNGDSFETEPFLIAAGTYTFTVLGATDTNRGKIDWYLDASVSPFWTGNDWNGSLTYGVEMSHSLTILTNGIHTIKGIINGTTSGDYYHALVMMWIK